MSDLTAQAYLQLLQGEKAKLALMACSVALRLDDETARKSIELVAQSKGSTNELLYQIKNLGCVWKQWDGSWSIAEDVRFYLLERLRKELPDKVHEELREYLATYSERRAKRFSKDGQITAYGSRQATFEAAYHRTLIAEQSAKGAEQLAQLWESSPPSAADATAETIDYLAPEISGQLEHVPPEVLFLQGMAARRRGHKRDQEKYFRAVWEQGRPGVIFSIAAQLFGKLTRNRELAERALRDALAWSQDDEGKAKVYHSLGDFLFRNLKLPEARTAYEESLKLRTEPIDKARVHHSLGNLFAKEGSWHQAEDSYEQSLELGKRPSHQAQVYHSIGNLLSQDPERWADAEKAYEKSFKIDPLPIGKAKVLASWANLLMRMDTPQSYKRAEEFALRNLRSNPNDPWNNGISYRILADVYEKQGEFSKAIEALESLMETDRKLGKTQFRSSITKRIAGLKKSQ